VYKVYVGIYLPILQGESHKKSLTKPRSWTKLYLQVIWLMTPPPDRQQKRRTLRRHGTLNAQPESVTHPLFQNSDFFDPDDLLQVKYEMLRQVHVDQNSISETARAFGFSRPSFYQAQSVFQQDGVFGLLPHKRGPQTGHKLTDEVMEFVVQQQSEDASRTPEQLAAAILKRFRVQVHPRSIQRRLRAEKKR
jgi:transposase